MLFLMCLAAHADDPCEQAPDHDRCVAEAAEDNAKADPAGAWAMCATAGSQQVFCQHDVAGIIAQDDPGLAIQKCASLDGDLVSGKSCWHGIGKFTARTSPSTAFAVCSQVPQGPDGIYAENCFAGLGWGAAEGQGLGFKNNCSEAGPFQDSCLLGVASQQRRTNQDQAAQVCGTLDREDLRALCSEIVQGG